jgi:Carboxypeptidase regulatory-like domain/TonB dependent receptor/TonB-dependent Receptor Plug Domain
MRWIRRGIAVCALSLLTAALASAQQTSGNVGGRVLDQSQAAVPGVTVTATNKATGFNRTVTSDAEGGYRLTSLPVGDYELKVELSGFSSQVRQVTVEVGANIEINFDLAVQGLTETAQVTAEAPLIETGTSAVGGVVDTRRVESMPLNGRQFANLAATIPGVSLGMHSDPTKSTQFAPQIGGGGGRNLNYQIDGGDNNDDTVGGLLQQFPLEAIDQFQVLTSRYKAEYGRSNGGVLNIVTKSGTNQMHGSWLTFFRDKSLNAQTETERLNDVEKQDYRRYQYGGSFGGPIIQSKLQYFAAFERTQQDTKQAVSTSGLFPQLDGIYPIPVRENLFTGKVTATLNPDNYLNIRYGYNNNSQPYDAGPQNTPNSWGDSSNKFNSLNVNHNLVLGATTLNEFIFQFANFRNHIAPLSHDTRETFPSGVAVGQSPNTPQTTEQSKYQFRDDFSWYVAGKGGIGHALKAGVNWIHEPHLFITFNTGKDIVQYAHLDDTLSGPISNITLNGGDASANIPLNQYAFYVQDDWKATSKLTLNLGLRYDVIKGYQIDQSNNPNFVKVQQAGAAGLLAGIKGLEDFGKDPKDDTNNWQPRVGFAYDVRGDGKDVIRGGWGVYQDVGYTNSNLLFAAADAAGRFGAVFTVDDQTGIKNPDGSLFRIGQPLSNLNSQNQSDPNSLPLFGQFLDPRLQMPYTRQTAFGWSHELTSNTVITVDYVNNQGRDLNTRPRLNTFINAGGPTRRLAFLNLQPNALGTRAGSSFGHSDYNALITSVKRRMTKGIDFTASYTYQKPMSTIGAAVDELNSNNLQDATLLYDDPRVEGPATRLGRHLLTISGIIQIKGGFQLAPLFYFRSKTPLAITEGADLNRNSENNDIPLKAYEYEGMNADGTANFKEIGDCKTWACGWGAMQTYFNLRASKRFSLPGHFNIDVYGEVFNMFNAKNPSWSANLARTVSAGARANPNFLVPTDYSGDFQQPDQRVGQIGFRFSF